MSPRHQGSRESLLATPLGGRSRPVRARPRRGQAARRAVRRQLAQSQSASSRSGCLQAHRTRADPGRRNEPASARARPASRLLVPRRERSRNRDARAER